MNSLIYEIYTTRKVQGKSGKIHKLHSEIDPIEGEFIYKLIANNSQITQTLEVGCGYGLSSLHICEALRGREKANHTIIDPFQNSIFDGAGIANLEKVGIDFFRIIEQKSEFALPNILVQGEEQLDFIFLDGWHTFDHTLLDCFYSLPLLRIGGFLVLDDCSFPSIRRVINYLRTYPCVQQEGMLSEKKSTHQLSRRIISTIFPQRVFRKIFSPSIQYHLWEDQVIRMIAFKKISVDQRNWDWYQDF